MMNSKKNAFYAQSGGVTAVINASACGVIETAAKSKKINKVLCGENGILGALNENLIDATIKDPKTLFESPIHEIFNLDIGFFLISSTVIISDKTCVG